MSWNDLKKQLNRPKIEAAFQKRGLNLQEVSMLITTTLIGILAPGGISHKDVLYKGFIFLDRDKTCL